MRDQLHMLRDIPGGPGTGLRTTHCGLRPIDADEPRIRCRQKRGVRRHVCRYDRLTQREHLERLQVPPLGAHSEHAAIGRGHQGRHVMRAG